MLRSQRATRELMIPLTGACESPWPIALSRSSRATTPTRRPSSSDQDAALAVALARRPSRARRSRRGRRSGPGVDMTRAAGPGRAVDPQAPRERARAGLREAAAEDRRRRLRVAAAAERAGERGCVELGRPAADDGEHALVHLDEQDERPAVGEVDDLVREVGDPVDVGRATRPPRRATSTPAASTVSSGSSSAERSSRSVSPSGVCRYCAIRSWRAPWRRHQPSASASRCVALG